MDQLSIDPLSILDFYKMFFNTDLRIPVLVTGIFFLSLIDSSSESAELAIDLFEDAEWRVCFRECQRILSVSPSDPTARLLESVVSLRLNRRIDYSITSLKKLSYSDEPTAIRAMAAYECGRAEWKTGNHDAAFKLLQVTFHNTLETELFLRGACSLFLLMKDKPELRKDNIDLVTQINTSRALWYGKLFEECRLKEHEKRTRTLARPGQWIVAFYRSQLSPAIGQRCSLMPSCSEYFLQACRKHGLLGFPMQGDRLVREPGVVMAGRNSVMVGGLIKYEDPVHDHDFWLD